MGNVAMTEKMRTVAAAKYAEMGEEHSYTGMVFGLAAILVEHGVPLDLLDEHSKYMVSTRPAEEIPKDPLWRLAHGLSCWLHDPLCSLDPQKVTFAQVAFSIDRVLERSYKGPASYWSEPSRSSYSSRDLAEWSDLASQVRSAFSKLRIRRNTPRARAFYTERREKVLEQIRGYVRDGIAREREQGKTRLDDLRKNLPEIEARLASIDATTLVRQAMVRALSADPDEHKSREEAALFAQAATVDGLIAARRAVWVSRRGQVEQHVAYEEKRLESFDIEKELKEGMSRYQELAPFLDPPPTTTSIPSQEVS